MNIYIKILVASALAIGMLACNPKEKDNATEAIEKQSDTEANANEELESNKGVVEDVLTKEEQDALTADMVIQSFKEGNERFTRNDLTRRNHSEQVRLSTNAQYPKAIVLSCVDS